MGKTRRLIVFSELERGVFYNPPNFDDNDREKYFNFSEEEIKLIKRSRQIRLNIYTAIQLAYFKVTGMFFYLSFDDVNQEDIKFLITRYFSNASVFLRVSVKHFFYTSKEVIIQHCGYKDWSKEFYHIAINKIAQIIRLDITPNFIGRELIKFFKNIKVAQPGYSILQDMVSEGLTIERNRINDIINNEITLDEKQSISSLILRSDGISVGPMLG